MIESGDCRAGELRIQKLFHFGEAEEIDLRHPVRRQAPVRTGTHGKQEFVAGLKRDGAVGLPKIHAGFRIPFAAADRPAMHDVLGPVIETVAHVHDDVSAPAVVRRREKDVAGLQIFPDDPQEFFLVIGCHRRTGLQRRGIVPELVDQCLRVPQNVCGVETAEQSGRIKAERVVIHVRRKTPANAGIVDVAAGFFRRHPVRTGERSFRPHPFLIADHGERRRNVILGVRILVIIRFRSFLNDLSRGVNARFPYGHARFQHHLDLLKSNEKLIYHYITKNR